MLRSLSVIIVGLATVVSVASVAPFATAASACALTRGANEPAGGKALMIITGRDSEVRAPRIALARSQEIFDALWLEHMGARVEKAGQGWPLTPKIDFAACSAVFIFGGDIANCNGYHIEDVITETDAVTVRYERDSYQTLSIDGTDSGEPVKPWAMILVPATDKTMLLEENVQGLIGGDPIWKQRAAFPGRTGVGRPVR